MRPIVNQTTAHAQYSQRGPVSEAMLVAAREANPRQASTVMER